MRTRMVTFGRGLLLATAVMVTLSSVARAGLTVSSACNGAGITGTLTSGNVSINFQSCPSGSDWDFRSWYSGGDITELLWDPATDDVTAWIGGVELTDSLTSSQQDAMATILLSSQGELTRLLYNQLVTWA